MDQHWVTTSGTPTDLDRYKYGYDRNSNRFYRQNTVGSNLDEFYTYDNLNRLTMMQRGTLTGGPPFTGISGTPVRELDYTLDPTGNWSNYTTKTSGTTDLGQNRTSNTVNQITTIANATGSAWASVAYDPSGNTTTMPQPNTPTSSYTALYDAWNRLTSIKASGTQVAQYQYDGQGRRIVKKTYTGGMLSETRHFYWSNQWQDLEERIGTATSADKQQVWGIRYVDELICRDDATPLRLYATQDANFNLTALIDTSANVKQRFIYDPYGLSTVLSAAWAATTDAYAWNWRHQGLYQDPETGLVYNRTRIINPLLGRPHQQEPFAQLYIDGANLYEAFGGNPVRLLDPYGTTPQFGVWSGINSDGYNYIENWNLPFQWNSGLSGMSGLTTLTTGPWPFAQPNLNKEARSASNPLPQTCGNIEILMIEPATSAGSPTSNCSCCKVHGTLLFNPYDNALGIAGFANDLPHRQQEMSGWGQAIPIAIPNSGLIGHTPGTFGPFPILQRIATTINNGKRPVTNITYPQTGRSFNPSGSDWYQSPEVQNADFAFVCHSQGCNMLLDALQKSCQSQ